MDSSRFLADHRVRRPLAQVTGAAPGPALGISPASSPCSPQFWDVSAQVIHRSMHRRAGFRLAPREQCPGKQGEGTAKGPTAIRLFAAPSGRRPKANYKAVILANGQWGRRQPQERARTAAAVHVWDARPGPPVDKR